MDYTKEKNCACQTCLEFIHLALDVSNIKNLIPLVLNTKNILYSRWSTPFRVTAHAYNVLDHIDSTIPTPSHIISDTTLWARLDAVVLTWIYATISTDLLITLLDNNYTTAMDAWTCLRDMFQHKTTTIHKCYKRRRNNKNLEGDQSDKVDLISSLPDDILVYLLSFVGIKAAARTGLLSKRWRHVWTYITDLDFEDPPRLAIAMTKTYENSKVGNYADWVNQVIRANQARYLNTFRMHFPIPIDDKIFASNIDKWLEFAFTKKVRNLELHMETIPKIPFFKNPTFVLNPSLVSLYLTKAVVDGPLLQWVLSNSLKLGRLLLHSCLATDDVFASSKRKKLVISSLTLKHLEIFSSTRLLNTESLHIVAPNLVNLLLFESRTVDVEYVNVPSLVDAAFGGKYSTKISSKGSILSGFSSQLEKLSLHWFMVPFQACKFPSFDNVKLLELSFIYDDGKYLFVSTLSLITECPLLHTFKLKIMLWSQDDYCTRLIPINVVQTNAIRTLQRLEALEFVGYAGYEYAGALAYHLTQHAPVLKKFILDPRKPEHVGELSNWYGNNERDYMEIARSKAKLLAKRIKSGVNVVIL